MIALMVEDSALVRSRLIPMLAAFSGVRVVGVAESATEALVWLRAHRCDLLLLDLSLRDDSMHESGLRLLDALANAAHADIASVPPLRVVLADGPSDALRRRCAALGASAVFDKAIQLDELFDFLRREHWTIH